MSEATLSPATIDAIVGGFAPLRARVVGQDHVLTLRLGVRRHIRHAPCPCVTIIARVDTGPLEISDRGDRFDTQLIEAGRGDRWQLIFARPMPTIHLRTADTFTLAVALTMRPEECDVDHASAIDPRTFT